MTEVGYSSRMKKGKEKKIEGTGKIEMCRGDREREMWQEMRVSFQVQQWTLHHGVISLFQQNWSQIGKKNEDIIESLRK